MDRPEYGYFCRAKVHDTIRPKPDAVPKEIYADATPSLPENTPLPPAKYGSRFNFLN
jgi:NADH dehydrogenase (ubiquinone) 1 alpha subcomplex subunit 8